MRKAIKHYPQSMLARVDSNQPLLPLQIERERDVGGIGMGVLSDGTPFLTQRGLAVLCGVQNAHIGTISADWNQDPAKPRIATIRRLLLASGTTVTSPHIKVPGRSGDIYAYPDVVCMAVLEYYSYEAGQQCQPEALKNFRRLATRSLRELIYREVGYQPEPAIPLAWQQFHDRVTANHDSVPLGFFSIFKELADLIVTLIREGANFGPEFVPDISVGQHWGTHWTDNDFDAKFGVRRRYEHNYPDYFRQAATNPQPAYCYPNIALAEYRQWMHDIYLKDKLKPYLQAAERKGKLPPAFTDTALRAIASRQPPKFLS